MTKVLLPRLLLLAAVVVAGVALARAPANASTPTISLSVVTPHLSIAVAM
ncbi:hypothetical protein [Sphingomonas sp. CCH5-D11]|jgi:hypothetical protein|nr:hypothetical protein [Sphingomonas sp. CCH5-D11]